MIVCERATRSVAHTHDQSLATQGFDELYLENRTNRLVHPPSSDNQVRERALRFFFRKQCSQLCLSPPVTGELGKSCSTLRTTKRFTDREERNFLAKTT